MLGKDTEAYHATLFQLFSSKPPDSGQSVGVVSLCVLLSDLALCLPISAVALTIQVKVSDKPLMSEALKDHVLEVV